LKRIPNIEEMDNVEKPEDHELKAISS